MTDDARLRGEARGPSAPEIRGALASLGRWLWEHPPWSIRTYSDRVLALALQPELHRDGRDLGRILRGAHKLTEACARADRAGDLLRDVTSAMVGAWALAQHGVDTGELSALLRRALPGMLPIALTWPEPPRSVLFYWAHRLGLSDPVPPGPRPTDPTLALYHDLHLAFYRMAYGEEVIPRGDCEPLVTSARAGLDRAGLADDPDALAEVLMVELSLSPRDDAFIADLTRRVLRAQQPDGGFADASDPEPAIVHHTACAALIALSRQLPAGGERW